MQRPSQTDRARAGRAYGRPGTRPPRPCAQRAFRRRGRDVSRIGSARGDLLRDRGRFPTSPAATRAARTRARTGRSHRTRRRRTRSPLPFRFRTGAAPALGRSPRRIHGSCSALRHAAPARRVAGRSSPPSFLGPRAGGRTRAGPCPQALPIGQAGHSRGRRAPMPRSAGFRYRSIGYEYVTSAGFPGEFSRPTACCPPAGRTATPKPQVLQPATICGLPPDPCTAPGGGAGSGSGLPSRRRRKPGSVPNPEQRPAGFPVPVSGTARARLFIAYRRLARHCA